MNRLHQMAFYLFISVVALCSYFAIPTMAQTPSPSPAPSQQPAKTPDKKEQENPFAPEPAGPLPAGMTGSNTSDPRAHLAPGFYNAGETAMGIKHVMLFNVNPGIKPGSAVPFIFTFADGTRIQYNARAQAAGDPPPEK